MIKMISPKTYIALPLYKLSIPYDILNLDGFITTLENLMDMVVSRNFKTVFSVTCGTNKMCLK
jgi:hypothetical protein